MYTGTAYYDCGPVFALTGRFGYFVTPGFLPIFALVLRSAKIRQITKYFPFPHYPISLSWISASKEKTVYGVVAGLGVEFPTFIGASTIRFEYTFNRTQAIAISDQVLPILGTHKFHYPETNAIKMAWVWNFDKK